MTVCQVEVGEYKLTVNDPGEQFRPVAEIVIHPEYNETNGANDLALVRVVPKLSLDGQYVAAVCLPGPFGPVSAHCRPHSRQNWAWPQGTRTAAVCRSRQMAHRSSSSLNCG